MLFGKGQCYQQNDAHRLTAWKGSCSHPLDALEQDKDRDQDEKDPIGEPRQCLNSIVTVDEPDSQLEACIVWYCPTTLTHTSTGLPFPTSP